MRVHVRVVCAAAQALHAWIAEGKLQPVVSLSVDCRHAKEAFATVRRREVVGKAVITFGGPDKPVQHAAKLRDCTDSYKLSLLF